MYGEDSFTFKVNDGLTDSSIAVAGISVTPVNDAPLANNDTASTDEENSITISVLTNDSDVEGDSLSLTGVASPGHGTATTSGNQVVYTPEKDFNGSDSFGYTIKDSAGAGATATVFVTVKPINDAPTVSGFTLDTEADTEVSGTFDAHDVDNDPLTFSISANPSQGSIQIVNQTTGAFIYVPYKDASGIDTFQYRANDGKLYSDSASVTINIEPAADSDNDGITDTDETTVYGTDPQNADTDGDGLKDKEEADYWGENWSSDYDGDGLINILDQDSDNDNFGDGVENQQGYNPIDEREPVVLVAVNAGGDDYTSPLGTVYTDDSFAEGGTPASRTGDVAGTDEDTLYLTERYGDFSYAVDVDNGAYIVKLKFAEIVFSSIGNRVFDVYVEGNPVVEDLDIFAEVGKICGILGGNPGCGNRW